MQTYQKQRNNIMKNLDLAIEFFKKNNLVKTPKYILSYHNINTKRDMAEIYGSGQYFLKIWEGVILEYYIANVEVNGIKYAYISMDKDTKEIYDYYEYVENGIRKMTDNTVVRFEGFSDLPQEYIEKAEYFQYKEYVIHWTEKPYGIILEYINPKEFKK